ncbi:hypothetical protein [Halorubrum persicum]|uniref:hypothetical protein n=1 Tax=Halorubrum persicum TaxID=1383844 RepID=UPI001181B519|nr:hypothetical protein [Halorubrum persicum]
MKGLGASAIGAAALGYDDGPVGGAQAFDWQKAGVAATTVVGGPVALLAYGASLGGPDDSEVASALDWQSHVHEFTRAREDQLLLEQTLSSLERDIQLVENKAREQAIFNIYEQGVDSGTEADATAAAEKAINDAYATVQKSILQTYSIRAARYKTMMNNLGTEILLGESTLGDYSTEPYGPIETASTTLYDGTTIDHQGGNGSGGGQDGVSGGDTALIFDPTRWTTLADGVSDGGTVDKFYINKPDPANYSSADSSDALDISESKVLCLDVYRFAQLLLDLETAHSNMMGEVSAMVSSYFQPAKNGEIDLYEAVGPQHLANTAETAKDYQEAAMALRAMGYPMSKQVVTFTLPKASGDGDLELTGRLSWTAHSGNTLDVGQTHNAANIPGSIFAAVNLPEGVDSISGNTTDTNTTNTTDTGSTTEGPGAEIVELTDEFTIVSAEGADGVSFNDRTLASSDLTNEEIVQIYKENHTANKEATENVHETATGGGGGLSGMSTTEKAIAVGVAALVALGILNN